MCIVVHDGEPKGRRVVEGRAYPVFEDLLLFQVSGLTTLTATVNAGEVADLDALIELFDRHGYGAEPASGFGTLCACCSEGTHEQERKTHAGARRVSFAAPEEEARRLLGQWAAQTPAGRSWSGLTVAG
ncbi:hypothetical protein [Streptomyces sp. NPDC046870]|uniref:hypothetical protein n=1 Tax=Streptomyces sp. NPDC046870 TaxID=3155135 RepID=UPI0034557721